MIPKGWTNCGDRAILISAQDLLKGLIRLGTFEGFNNPERRGFRGLSLRTISTLNSMARMGEGILGANKVKKTLGCNLREQV